MLESKQWHWKLILTCASTEGILVLPEAPITIETSPFELRTIEGHIYENGRFPLVGKPENSSLTKDRLATGL